MAPLSTPQTDLLREILLVAARDETGAHRNISPARVSALRALERRGLVTIVSGGYDSFVNRAQPYTAAPTSAGLAVTL